MRLPLAVAAVLVVAATSGCSATEAVEDPADAPTCEALVDLAADRIRDVVSDLGASTVEDLTEANPEDPFVALTEPFTGFRERSDALGCIGTETDSLICERLDGLMATGPVAEDFLAGYYDACG